VREAADAARAAAGGTAGIQDAVTLQISHVHPQKQAEAEGRRVREAADAALSTFNSAAHAGMQVRVVRAACMCVCVCGVCRLRRRREGGADRCVWCGH